MTKTPEDLDVWLDFVSQLNKPKPTQCSSTFTNLNVLEDYFDSKNLHTDNGDWDYFTNNMDWINQKRHQYNVEHPLDYIKKNLPVISSHKTEHLTLAFNNVEERVLPLDRNDKKHLKKTALNHLAVVDLHGYTLSSGYEKLKSAFLLAHQKKSRIIKVITGKGRPNPESQSPTLKQIFPKWMQEIYFQSLLTKVRKAPPEHGGDGAFLVYLKQFK